MAIRVIAVLTFMLSILWFLSSPSFEALISILVCTASIISLFQHETKRANVEINNEPKYIREDRFKSISNVQRTEINKIASSIQSTPENSTIKGHFSFQFGSLEYERIWNEGVLQGLVMGFQAAVFSCFCQGTGWMIMVIFDFFFSYVPSHTHNLILWALTGFIVGLFFIGFLGAVYLNNIMNLDNTYVVALALSGAVLGVIYGVVGMNLHSNIGLFFADKIHLNLFEELILVPQIWWFFFWVPTMPIVSTSLSIIENSYIRK